MSNQPKKKRCDKLQELAEDENLEYTSKLLESDEVVMDEDGQLHFRDFLISSRTTDWMAKRNAELSQKRKEMVLALNGREKHELEEANEKIKEEWDSFIEEHTGRLGKAVRFIKSKVK